MSPDGYYYQHQMLYNSKWTKEMEKIFVGCCFVVSCLASSVLDVRTLPQLRSPYTT
ncbi:UNVERIFIED_CONTAM: hypothetical protein Slati_1773600 [Sesamum latifolium]|uniref:Uncharacterized protein n=1 Tax=Sesamum latifolium TaxID=2727402 RepID=A0AAW2WX37_9LAMI